MAGSESSAPPRGGMSLYANLLEPSGDSSTTISRAPISFKQSDAGDGSSAGLKKAVDPALRFQPIRRPVVTQKKSTKPAMAFPKAIPPSSVSPAAPQAPKESGTLDVPAPQKPTLADFTATMEEDAVFYGTGEPKRKRKKKKKKDEWVETDWDEPYDPSRPTNVDEYLRSDERIREIHEWKDTVLYRHKLKKRDEEDQRGFCSEDEDEDEHKPRPSRLLSRRPPSHKFGIPDPDPDTFAPPSSYKFAPPPPSPPRSNMPDDATGEDAFARRVAMSQGMPPPQPLSPPPPPPAADPSLPPAAPAASAPEASTISREPVRYAKQGDHEPIDKDKNDDEDDHYSPSSAFDLASNSKNLSDDQQQQAPVPRSNRPGQAGFAERLMGKYGWSAGSGLGASSSGIINPLEVRVEKARKRRKKADSEGGGWADSKSAAATKRGKIIGGQVSRATREKEESESMGKMSPVIVLRGMLDGMTDEELADELREGELQQEIGGECGDKYGRVERLHVDLEGRGVYVKFTDQVSALRVRFFFFFFLVGKGCACVYGRPSMISIPCFSPPKKTRNQENSFRFRVPCCFFFFFFFLFFSCLLEFVFTFLFSVNG